VLALSGDYPVTGYEGAAAPVFDTDSVGLLRMLEDMNEGTLRMPPGDESPERTSFFLGAVVTNHTRLEREVMPQYFKLRKKVENGARFVINQIGWDVRKDDELLRWIRGDWQLLPLLLRPGRYPIRAVNRWKMVDNLRRSLVAPASLALLAAALATDVVSPWVVLALVALAFTAGPLMGTIAGIRPSRDDVARVHFYRQWVADLRRVLLSGAWLLGQLMQLALMAIDAIVRAVWRTAVSRRRLLEWTTAAAAQASATTELPTLVRKHWGVVLAAIGLWAWLMAIRAPNPLFATVLCVAWALSPVWTWWVSRPRPARRADALSPTDRDYLLGVARETWRLFERCVVPEDHHLPPDNLQIAPHDMVAHRTSPTNIGLYLLATMCAREYGWIGCKDALTRLDVRGLDQRLPGGEPGERERRRCDVVEAFGDQHELA